MPVLSSSFSVSTQMSSIISQVLNCMLVFILCTWYLYLWTCVLCTTGTILQMIFCQLEASWSCNAIRIINIYDQFDCAYIFRRYLEPAFADLSQSRYDRELPNVLIYLLTGCTTFISRIFSSRYSILPFFPPVRHFSIDIIIQGINFPESLFSWIFRWFSQDINIQGFSFPSS